MAERNEVKERKCACGTIGRFTAAQIAKRAADCKAGNKCWGAKK